MPCLRCSPTGRHSKYNPGKVSRWPDELSFSKVFSSAATGRRESNLVFGPEDVFPREVSNHSRLRRRSDERQNWSLVGIRAGSRVGPNPTHFNWNQRILPASAGPPLALHARDRPLPVLIPTPARRWIRTSPNIRSAAATAFNRHACADTPRRSRRLACLVEDSRAGESGWAGVSASMAFSAPVHWASSRGCMHGSKDSWLSLSPRLIPVNNRGNSAGTSDGDDDEPLRDDVNFSTPSGLVTTASAEAGNGNTTSLFTHANSLSPCPPHERFFLSGLDAMAMAAEVEAARSPNVGLAAPQAARRASVQMRSRQN